MTVYDSCKSATDACIRSQTFAVAHLYNDEKPMNIHIHDCYEVYYSISGGKQFLIDNRFYSFHPVDIFFINQYESHYLSRIDNADLERVILSIYPDYLKKFSTEQTDLNYCFTCRSSGLGHKISLSAEEQKRFLYYIHKLSYSDGYGQAIMDTAIFLELLIFLNRIFLLHCDHDFDRPEVTGIRHGQIDDILSYVNRHLTESLTIQSLADHFYLSSSYLCKIFKKSTGTTINKYISAKRITKAKSLLSNGHSVSDTCAMCGFGDYSNFLKVFTKAVGITPKKYAQISNEN